MTGILPSAKTASSAHWRPTPLYGHFGGKTHVVWQMVNSPDFQSALAALYAHLQQRFPDRVVGAYLFGSQADTTAVDTSDIDFCVVVDAQGRDALLTEVRDEGLRFAKDKDISRLDLIVFDKRQLLADGQFRIKSCSRHVFGEDIRPAMPDLSLDAYLRAYSHAPIAYMVNVLRRAEWVSWPVGYPDPAGPYFGYDTNQFPPTMEPVANVKALVSTVCWIASVLVSFRSGQSVASTREAVIRYRAVIDDAWAPFVEEVHSFGKHTLGYLVPTAGENQARLRRICAEMPDLENHYLVHYRDYLLAEARSRDHGARLGAAQRFAEVRFADSDVLAALHDLASPGEDHPEVRNAAASTLQAIG
jgi:hypothetical protein